MNIKDIENLLKQRYSKMSEEDKEVIRDMYYSDVAGPVLRRFMGGSVANTFKLRKPNKMALGNRVPPPGYIGGYNENAAPQETIADDKPMDAREGDFIINAAAAEFAGKQDIQRMINGAITNLREKGVELNFGNPQISPEDNVKLLVSQNEVFIPKEIAKEIGYDRLGKINNRGKKRTREIQEQQTAPQQEAPAGVMKVAEGDKVEKQAGIAEDILRYFGIGGQGDLPSEKSSPKVKKLKKEEQKGFAQPPKLPADLQKTKDEKRRFFDLVKGAVNMQEGGVKTKAYIPMDGNKPAGRSGVTIGRGVDLGQHTAAKLKRIGFSEDLIQKFKPFLGKQKGEALRAWEKSGKKLEISPEDAEYISDMMLYYKMEQFNDRFKNLKKIADPRVKAVLVAEHFGGRLGLDLYKGFRNAMSKPNANLIQAYKQHVHNNDEIGKKGSYMKNAATNLTSWFTKTPGVTIKNVDPKQIKIDNIKKIPETQLRPNDLIPKTKFKPKEITPQKQIIPETRPFDELDPQGNPRESTSFLG